MGSAHEQDFASRMMNDATLRQMAAAKTTVNNENHMLRASSAGFILPSAARQLKRLSPFHKTALRCKQCDQRKQSEDAQTRLPMAPTPNASQFEVLLLPADGTSAATRGSGDLGTSPFYGQLSDKLQLVFVNNLGCRT